AEPAAHPVTPVEGNQGLGMRRAQSVQMRASLPSEMKQVLEAFVRDECGPRTAPLEQRVGRNRRAVGEVLHLASADRTHGGEHRLFLVHRGGNLRGAN